MSDARTFILAIGNERRQAMQAVAEAPTEFTVELKPTTRTDKHSRRFHAMCTDISKSGIEWAGKTRSKDEWKVLLVSGHTKATKGDVEFVPGLEGEFVNLREQTSKMGSRRMTSLVEYTQAFGDLKGVVWSEPADERA